MKNSTPQFAGFDVVAITFWTREFGGVTGLGGTLGQVTQIRIAGVDAFVRENFRLDTFVELNSGTRMGALERRMPGQVLELATDGNFAAIAAVVTAADPLKRRVVRNRAWTTSKARALMHRANHSARMPFPERSAQWARESNRIS